MPRGPAEPITRSTGGSIAYVKAISFSSARMRAARTSRRRRASFHFAHRRKRSSSFLYSIEPERSLAHQLRHRRGSAPSLSSAPSEARLVPPQHEFSARYQLCEFIACNFAERGSRIFENSSRSQQLKTHPPRLMYRGLYAFVARSSPTARDAWRNCIRFYSNQSRVLELTDYRQKRMSRTCSPPTYRTTLGRSNERHMPVSRTEPA